MTPAILATFTALSIAAAQPAPAPAPAPAPTAETPAPAPADPSNATTWDQVERTTTTTTTTTTTATVPPPVVTQDALPPPPPRPRNPAATALMASGGGLLGLGVVSLLFIAAPAALVKRVALRRADDEDTLAFSSRETRYRRARNADNVMEGAFWAGISGVVIGTVLLTTGAVLKNRAERAPRTAHRERRPMVRLDGGAGGLRLRF